MPGAPRDRTVAVGFLIAVALVSFFGGIIFAVIALYAPWIIRQPFRLIEWVFMGTPLLLQLFLIYFGLVQIGIDLPAFVAGIIGLGLHFAVYNSELIQTAILSVDKGQMEAARTVGLSRGQALRKVVIPQAVRDVIPPIGNNMIALLKDSALVSVIGVSELTLSAQRAIGATYRPFEFYLVAAAFYYVINLCMEWVQRRIERRMQVRQMHTLPEYRDLLLGELFARGAFAGATAEQSFRVVTDEGVNPPQSVEAGRFVVELRVAPSLPMRFIAVRLAQNGERLTVKEQL